MKLPTIFRDKDPVATLEADRAKRGKRITALEAELAAAQTDVSARTVALDEAVAKDLDEGVPAQASATARAALDNASALVQSLSGSVARERVGLASAEASLSKARETAAREEAAATVEGCCSAVEIAASKLDAPIAALAKAVEALRPTIEAAYAGKAAKPEAITATIVAEALAHFMPECFGFVRLGSGHAVMAGSGLLRGAIRADGSIAQNACTPSAEAKTAAEFARATMVRERQRAAGIRAGTTPLPLPPRPVRPAEPAFRADPRVRLVVLIKSVKYRDRNGDPIVVMTGQNTVPRAVAEEAIRRGFAFGHGTPEADNALARLGVAYNEKGPPVPDAGTAIDLSIDLRDVVKADIAKQRDQWRAAQGDTSHAA